MLTYSHLKAKNRINIELLIRHKLFNHIRIDYNASPPSSKDPWLTSNMNWIFNFAAHKIFIH